MASKSDFLSKVPLFRSFDDDDLRRFADVTRKLSFGRGENLFEVGQPGRSLYIITKGNVQVLQPSKGTDVQLARMGPGDFLGEMAIPSDAPRSATARALDDVEALVLDKTVFRELVERLRRAVSMDRTGRRQSRCRPPGRSRRRSPPAGERRSTARAGHGRMHVSRRREAQPLYHHAQMALEAAKGL